MKRILGVTLVCLMAVCTQAQLLANNDKAPAKTKGFIENFEQAKKEATALNQPILALFTGSDWCPWCVKLHEEVFNQKEFQKFAADNLVLFEADFPRRTQQSASLKTQNAELSQTYGVSGFPTVFLLSADGKQLAQTGYKKGGAAAYVKSLSAMLEQAGVKVVDKATAAGQTASASDKMKTATSAKNAPACEKK